MIKTGLKWQPIDKWENIVVDNKYTGEVFYREKKDGKIKSRKYNNGIEDIKNRIGYGIMDQDENYNPIKFALSHGK